MATTSDELAQFLSRLRALCQSERMAEVEQSSLLLSACSPKLLEQKGLALLGLGVSSVQVGLGGKSLIELERPSAYHTSPNFPPHTFRPGDIARVEPNITGAAGKRGAKPPKKQLQASGDSEAQASVEGVVSDTRIVVSVEAESQDIELPERCRIIKLANSVTFDRMDRAIDSLERLVAQQPSDAPPSAVLALPLAQSLLAMKPMDPFAQLSQELIFKDDNLNDSQKEAVRFALESPEIALIHGPPGTGKTQTLVEIIRQLVERGKRVLVCGASNLAGLADNLLERLIPHQIPLTRIGHPARVLGNLHTETLEAQAARSDQAALAADAKSELEAAMSLLAGKGKTRPRGAERKKMWEEVRELRKEYRNREKVVVRSVLSEAKIVLATCHTSGSRQLANMHFDVVCIDEACQALEAVCWIPILKGSKLILAGDPLQLPPTIISLNGSSQKHSASKPTNPKASKKPISGKPPKSTPKSNVSSSKGPRAASEENDLNSSANSDNESVPGSVPLIQPANPRKLPRLVPLKSLEVTLFQRLEHMYGPSIKRMLTTQYRMHKKIAEFPSETLYGSTLISHESVASHLLRDLPGVSADQALAEITSEPVVFFDTAGCEFYEKLGDEGGDEGSRCNENEATIVKKWVEELVSAGLAPAQIAIIAPYQAQVTLLATMLRPIHPEIEIGTVDGMQGREKEAVILSLVRSNDKREVGFLKEKRRLNVAMTRPRRHLCVVGDSSTVEKGGSYLKKWMGWLESNADVRYAVPLLGLPNFLAAAELGQKRQFYTARRAVRLWSGEGAGLGIPSRGCIMGGARLWGSQAPHSASTMSQNKAQDKVAIEHLEDNKSATFSEDIEINKHRGIDQEIAQFAAQHAITIDEETNKRLLWKINKRVLAVMLVTYFIQSLDKGTMSFAAIMGIQKDANLHGQEYAALTTIFYAGSLVAEFPVNILCQKFPIGKFLGTAVVLWGTTLALTAVCKSFASLMVVRYLLGTFEAAVQPCFMLMTSMWYKRAEQGEYVSYWYAMNGLQQMVGGLLSYGVSHIHSPNIKSWQVLFTMLGAATVLWGIFIWFYLPDSPMRAKCYTDEDKTLMVERVRENQTGIQNKSFKREQAIEAFTDIQVWFYVLMQILNTLPTSGIGAFGNLIIKDGFGFDTLQTSLLSIVQGTVHILIVTSVAWAARKTKQTLYIMMAICVPMVATTSVLMTVPNGRSTRVGLLIAFYGTFWFNGVAVLLLSMITRNIAGQTKKSIVLTMSFIAWAAGNMIGPQVFQTKDAPRYRIGFTVHLAFYVAQIIVFFVLRLILVRRNKVKIEAAKAQGRTEEVNLDNAFDDMTDMENPEFRYQY
ncbi:DNA polymerase alpha-associated DNA helicase A [Ceratobasidium theobromae]|uniref:DNA helicase n=1 Tax=Ceratobasidium theobromae TaxID=1582974 RepID=A0A5N5QNU9_9AGAM|nr:DNA polymerase alpha-associated DNA helicase A [Ceratobasidium theobromae]